MSRAFLIVLTGAALGFAATADAQVCNGSASFSNGPYQAVASAAFTDNSKSFGGGLGFGGPGAFGQASIGTTSYDDVDGSSTLVGIGAGFQVALGAQRLAHLCPLASVGFAFGPNNIDLFGDGSVVLDLKETDFSFGLALGILASRSAQTQVIPTASLSFVSATLKASDDVSGQSDSNSETFGLVGLGLGLVFNQVFTLRPGVAIPFGLDGASTSFGVALGVSFGGKSH
jgi:hypothetical protein